ncbi:MAG: hypothetical protein M1536_02730 [Firmicutes bacterium]|nr:hypothetical protein [Bacillota bacterium]
MAEEKEKNIKETSPEGTPFYPDHVIKEVMVVFFVTGIVLTLAILFPLGLRDKIIEFLSIQSIKPPWYFLFIHQAIRIIPGAIAVSLLTLWAVIFLFWPFFDEWLDFKFKAKKLAMKLGGAVLAVIIVLTIIGYLSGQKLKIGNSEYMFNDYGIPVKATESGAMQKNQQEKFVF